MDYSFYYREDLTAEAEIHGFDLFLSAYNSSERLTTVFDSVRSENKFWLIFPEYEFLPEELPDNGVIIQIEGENEAVQGLQIYKALNLESFRSSKICIDATGFMRPQLIFLLNYLKVMGFKKIDFLYSEPATYSDKEKTKFSFGAVTETRVVIGYGGTSEPNDGEELLIIASGYDSTLIQKTAQFLESADIVHLLGFPSLKADMYQENILRTLKAPDSLTADTIFKPIYAPAADPFETASTLKKYIDENDCLTKYKKIYIAPLSTKAQALGIALLYINEFQSLNSKISIVYPFTDRYSKETSKGISKLWKYTVEF